MQAPIRSQPTTNISLQPCEGGGFLEDPGLSHSLT